METKTQVLLMFSHILNKNNMKHAQSSTAGNQTKAVSFLIVCIACSLMLSTAVVTYVAKWLLTA
jgi:hypothetical protein